MKKLVFTLLAGALLLANINLRAQEVSGFRFGIGLEGALPVNGLAGYDYGGGATLRFGKGVAENIDVTLTGGIMGFIPKDISPTIDTKAALFFPIKAGGRYMISKNFYAMAEAGVTVVKTFLPKVTGTSGSFTSVNSSSFTYAPGLGVRFGGLDIGARYEGLDGAGFFGVRLGYDF
ncbi:MAG: hypothetical protein REI78_05315 [Pedobacter sp.]|nr:hypothetical protein [Pedobacter sp.]MDQ8052419.1 hypothetical protein [Pedobacter sp.]